MTQPSKIELEKLYWQDGLSTRKIEARFGLHQSAVLRLMRRYNLPRRNRIAAVIKGCKRYEKTPFSGDLNEKAYLLGLTFADFRRRRHGYQIDIATGTTHPAFARLFKKIFEKYAPVSERPYFNASMKRYGWRLETQLHPSFDFLLSPKMVPVEIMANEKAFFYFLAGYADGEGTISVGKNSATRADIVFAIASSDKLILDSLFKGLTLLNFKPSIYKIKSAGDSNVLYGVTLYYKSDTWQLRVKRRKELIRLLKSLPLQHSEKIRAAEFVLAFHDTFSLQDVREPWAKLKNEIKREVDDYVSRAALELCSSLKCSQARA